MSATRVKEDIGVFRKVLATLNEAQRRWLVGREALRLGRGGIQRMVGASGLSKPTILKGIRELHGQQRLSAEEGRVRQPGGGRKPIEEGDPGFTRALERVMDESTVGDPMSATTSETRLLAAGQPEGQGGRIARRPGPAVSLYQRDRQAVSEAPRASDFGGHQKEGAGRELQE